MSNYIEAEEEIKKRILEREGCYFCGGLTRINYLIPIGKYFICTLCWKKFSLFLKEWLEHDVFKTNF